MGVGMEELDPRDANRILVVDDNVSVHEDIQKILVVRLANMSKMDVTRSK